MNTRLKFRCSQYAITAVLFILFYIWYIEGAKEKILVDSGSALEDLPPGGPPLLLTRMWHGSGLEPNISHMHWDILVMRPTLKLDDLIICENGFIVDFVK